MFPHQKHCIYTSYPQYVLHAHQSHSAVLPFISEGRTADSPGQMPGCPDPQTGVAIKSLYPKCKENRKKHRAPVKQYVQPQTPKRC